MAVKLGKLNISLEDILSRVTELDILHHYLGITHVPCIISSPLRVDNHPSFGFYSLDGNRIYWTDLSLKDKGGTFDLLGKLWHIPYNEVLIHLWEDLPNISKVDSYNKLGKPKVVATKDYDSSLDLQCKVREWEKHDIEYWESYGITLEWLKYANIHPIAYKIITKGETRMVFPADKYAYAYVENKEGRVTLKIYQPFNKQGFKWSNRHDRSVISLWTKVPEYGEKICICSSMKDALCLWANTGIPSLAIQGEGYGISNTAVNELSRRYGKVYILLDNDEAGLIDSAKLAMSTGFINVVLPSFEGGKDISDLIKIKGKEEFLNIILPLFGIENTEQEIK